jgi:hypothetical protein
MQTIQATIQEALGALHFTVNYFLDVEECTYVHDILPPLSSPSSWANIFTCKPILIRAIEYYRVVSYYFDKQERDRMLLL